MLTRLFPCYQHLSEPTELDRVPILHPRVSYFPKRHADYPIPWPGLLALHLLGINFSFSFFSFFRLVNLLFALAIVYFFRHGD